MAYYTFNHNGLPPDNPSQGEMALATAQGLADGVARKVRGTFCQVKDTSGAVVYTSPTFAAQTSAQGGAAPA